MPQLPILSLGLIYWPTIFLVKREVKQLARQRGVELTRIWWLGAILRSPAYLSLWISTEKDWERDQLDRDRSFAADINAALLRYGYPSEAVQYVGVVVESQQTVDREFAGSWWYRMK
jgi:hypothetical protein